MIQIRKQLFETNSSSTHAICVTRTMGEVDPKSLYSYEYDDAYCFGRCESYLVESWSAKLAYAYIVVNDLSQWETIKDLRDTENDVKNFKRMVNEITKDYFIDPKDDEYEIRLGFTKKNFSGFFKYVDNLCKEYNAYVDHVEDFIDNGFYEKLVTDKEFIRRFVFDEDSYITIGGDEYRGYNIKTIGFEYDYYSKYNGNPMNDDNYFETWHDPRDYHEGEFWDKLKEYEKDFEVFLKGN